MNWSFCTLLLTACIITGCVSPTASQRYPEVAARQPPAVQLGAELKLFDKELINSISLISQDGRLHFFMTDEKKQLYHLEILNDIIKKKELIGASDNNSDELVIDAVEHPIGKLRVLFGDRQYIRSVPDGSWQEVTGNRCARYVSVNNNLFCGFISSDKEFQTPNRTDWTIGLFYVLPIVTWSNEYASKLVLAQEFRDDWIIRAVVDLNTTLDVNQDFLLGSDNLGMLHALYYASRGGEFWWFELGLTIYPSPFIYSLWAEPELRHVQISMDRLLSEKKESPDVSLGHNGSRSQWLAIQGEKIAGQPFVYNQFPGEFKVVRTIDFDKKTFKWPFLDEGNCHELSILEMLRPLYKHFTIEPSSGEIWGLIYNCVDQWISIGIGNNHWLPVPEIVSVSNLPDTRIEWREDDSELIRYDNKGNIHALLTSCNVGLVGTDCIMTYYRHSAGNWFAPLILGKANNSRVRSLSIGSSGDVFASWTNDKGELIGRWIRVQDNRPK